jgi:hypothetical protein
MLSPTRRQQIGLLVLATALIAYWLFSVLMSGR